MQDNKQNIFEIDGSQVTLDELINGYKKSKSDKKTKNKAEKKRDEPGCPC